MTRTFHYAPLHNINDWLSLGWLPHAAFASSHHGNYSVLVEWLCDCQFVRPK